MEVLLINWLLKNLGVDGLNVIDRSFALLDLPFPTVFCGLSPGCICEINPLDPSGGSVDTIMIDLMSQ